MTATYSEIRRAEKGERRYLSLAETTFVYTLSEPLACPECYAPVARGLKDGRCELCKHDRNILPVNYRRSLKKKRDDEDEREDRYDD